jgi:hypothetical protein
MSVQQVPQPMTHDAPQGPAAPSHSLPQLSTTLTAPEILTRLDAAARRGKLAGFHPAQSPDLFEVEAYSEPFDHTLIATATPGPDRRLTFRLHMLRRKPWIFATIIIVSIWPGLPLTHSMLLTWFTWYHLSQPMTAAWYLPLTVLPLPWMLRNWLRKSRAEAIQAANDQITRITELLGATTIP